MAVLTGCLGPRPPAPRPFLSSHFGQLWSHFQPALNSNYGHRIPRPAVRCWNAAQVKLGSNSAGRHAIQFGKDRKQRLGAFLGCITVLDALGIQTPKLDTSGLGSA